ncbi:MAG: tetratricopeptide repeat protein, partial [Halothece sp. Uz-M2-17]|nr:tetratricopeptide repeat protein [Halothece sp. Uz-M2-17]
MSLALTLATPIEAQTPFKNPLQVENFNDPLLPQTPVQRPLSPLEKLRLKEALDELHEKAQLSYQQGKIEEAFQVWYRELRLRQKLDPINEVEALGRVGKTAWLENRSTDFRNIRERLRVIAQQAQENNNRQLLETIAENYEQMRELEGAIALYEKLVEDSNQPNPLLEKIAQLHANQFHYQAAADVYERLLDQAEQQANTTAVINYLKQLTTWYEQAENPEAGIKTKQRLIDLYQQQNNQQALPAILVSLAEDYVKLDQFDQASTTYQEAFQIARSQQKYAIAAMALENLAQLYHNDGSLQATLEIYEQLLIIQQ